MIPSEKVKSIVDRHTLLEKELSTGNVDSKTYAKKSKVHDNKVRYFAQCHSIKMSLTVSIRLWVALLIMNFLLSISTSSFTFGMRPK